LVGRGSGASGVSWGGPMKVVTVLGARPQFIKAAAVARALRSQAGVENITVNTGQHYDPEMSQVFFRELDIPQPDHDLVVGSGTHAVQTGLMMTRLEPVLMDERPDWVLVFGDTNSSLAGALTAAKLLIPVAHVEAGLRSFNRAMPEEINRVMVDHLSHLLFAPTDASVANLRNEGVADTAVHLVGDVMVDAARIFGEIAEDRSLVIRELGLENRAYVLATVHRAENTDDLDRLRAIIGGLILLAKDIPVVLPMHPRTRAAVSQLGISLEPMRIIEPVGYLDMIMLERSAAAIATDSGGVQKEAFFYEVPCATLRDETEWVELVELGWNKRVRFTEPEDVYEGVRSIIGTKGHPGLPYGDGYTADKIVAILQESR
jgi:UDP-GlcNAc3NAcA epimerase